VAYEVVKNLALTAENLGYHSIFSNDHLVRGEGGYILEGWTVLSALAAITTRIRLGNLVLCNAFRYPQLLAKMSSTLDVISCGRFELGIGSGWLADEFTEYSIPFPKPAVRIAQLREALEVIKLMWTLDRASYQGKYYALQDAICEPKPVQKPYPPILVGGGGEQLTLKVVAECGDICNFGGSPEAYAHKLDVLKQHCERVGRSFDEIELSWTGDFTIAMSKEALEKKIQMIKPKHMALEDYLQANIVGTPEACLRKVEEYLDLGVTYFTIGGFS
jgi:alkanesulfonate monooxygenase SsuD/methylene tetrahydromethanopterin reductase-like flavin-dependent oxidoreductase (luciferase family)